MLRFLLNYLLSFGFIGFAAGSSVVNAGGEGGDGAALVDTGGSEEGEVTQEEGTEEEGESGTEEETQTEEQKTAAATKSEKLDLRTVPQDVKTHLQEVAKTNSKLANFLQNAIYTSQNFLREVPGGLKAVQELKTAVEEAGGLEEIKTLRETHQSLVEEQESMDRQARSGDPAVLENLVQIAGKEGFSKLMPTAIEKWRAQDPEMYSHIMAKTMVNALSQANVLADMNIAFRMLRLKDGVGLSEGIEALKRAADSINNIGVRASKAPEKPKVDPIVAQEKKAIEDDRSKLFNEKFHAAFEPWQNGRIKGIVKDIAPKGKTFTDYQMKTLIGKVREGLSEILAQDTKYISALERLYQARNMDELLKFTQNRTDKVLKNAVVTAYNGLFRDYSGKKKPVTPPPAAGAIKTQQQQQNGQKPPVNKNWVKVEAAKAPTPDEIDNNATDFRMKFNKQAILKDGRRVYWGDKVPK